MASKDRTLDGAGKQDHEQQGRTESPGDLERMYLVGEKRLSTHRKNDALPTRTDRMNDDGVDEMIEGNTAGPLCPIYVDGGRGEGGMFDQTMSCYARTAWQAGTILPLEKVTWCITLILDDLRATCRRCSRRAVSPGTVRTTDGPTEGAPHRRVSYVCGPAADLHRQETSPGPPEDPHYMSSRIDNLTTVQEIKSSSWRRGTRTS